MTIATDNNPKRRAGALKVPLEYVPTSAEAYIALVLEAGAKKYGPFNWRNEPISITTYVGAIRRHIGAIMDGQDIDPETGLPHWAHIAASCSIALDALTLGKLIDDRPVTGSAPELLDSITAQRARRYGTDTRDQTEKLMHEFVGREVLQRYQNRYPVGARTVEEVEEWQAKQAGVHPADF